MDLSDCYPYTVPGRADEPPDVERLPTEPRMSGTKDCQGPCGRSLHVLAFFANPRAEDGLMRWCRDCTKERSRKKAGGAGRSKNRGRAGGRTRITHRT